MVREEENRKKKDVKVMEMEYWRLGLEEKCIAMDKEASYHAI